VPIGFSEYQLNVIRSAACHVPAKWRARFLEAVVDQVLPHPSPSDETVEAAVVAVLGRLRAA